MSDTESRWPLRSLLFVPAHRQSWVSKAIAAGPDAVVLDLEDSVPPEQQSAARAALPASIAMLNDSGIAAVVRIHPFSAESASEIETVVMPGLNAVMLPKADHAAQVAHLADLLSYHEGRREMAHGSVAILPLPETAAGLQNAESLARASSRVRGIVGTVSGPVSGDVAQAFGFRATRGGVEQLYLNSKLVLDSRAGGAPWPIAGVFGVPLDDLEAIEAMLIRARDFGYTGSPVMHPSHVEIANRVYAPTAEEAEYFTGLLQAFESAEREGLGAVKYRGAMVDYAMLPLARQTVAEYRRRQLRADRSRG